MARVLANVPLKHVLPAPDEVLVRRFDTSETAAGLHLPDAAAEFVYVAQKVGADVKHVQEGDVVLCRAYRAAILPYTKEPCAFVPGDEITGVIRGYDWRAEVGPKLATGRAS